MGDFFGLADAAIDGFTGQVFEAVLDITMADVSAAEAGAQHGGIDCAGQDGVDADLVRRKFNRHGAGQGQQSAFAGGVGGDIGRCLDGVDR